MSDNVFSWSDRFKFAQVVARSGGSSSVLFGGGRYWISSWDGKAGELFVQDDRPTGYGRGWALDVPEGTDLDEVLSVLGRAHVLPNVGGTVAKLLGLRSGGRFEVRDHARTLLFLFLGTDEGMSMDEFRDAVSVIVQDASQDVFPYLHLWNEIRSAIPGEDLDKFEDLAPFRRALAKVVFRLNGHEDPNVAAHLRALLAWFETHDEG